MKNNKMHSLALQTELADLEAEMAVDFNVKSQKELGYGA